MSAAAVRRSKPWFTQAQSDTRTAEALLAKPEPMTSDDIGCHLAAMCAQALEKSLKGYMFLNGATPALDHRPDGYLEELLKNRPLLHHKDHYGKLSALFDAPTKGTLRQLLELTPGGLGNRTDVPNTEYPWTDGAGQHNVPVGAPCFADPKTANDWLLVARRVTDTLHKLMIAVDRSTLR